MTNPIFNGERPPPAEFGSNLALQVPHLRRWVIGGAIVLTLIVLFILLSQAKGIYADWLWFDKLGYRSVFAKVLGMKIWLFFAGSLVFAALLLPNLLVAYRFSRGPSTLQLPPDMLTTIRRGSIAVVVLAAVIMSVVFGVVVLNRWETFLIFMNKVSFGIQDPQYNKDISFYVSDLPVLHFIQGWLMGAVIAIIVAMGALYFLRFAIRGAQFDLTPRIRGHFAVLGALLMLTIAAAHYLDTFEPLFSGGGAAFGASYADVNARILALWIITGVAALSAVGFIASLYFGGLRFMIASFGLWALFAIGVGAGYPAVVQRFTVDPDEFNKEQPFIQRNLDATRAAYGLENVQVQSFPYRPTLTAADVRENSQTINNVRLWDPIPLTANYNRLQFFELYYNFVQMDVDRYTIDGEYRQVMLSGRELSPEDLPEEAQRWVNRKLQYTHGYGVAMSPVSSFTREGTPEFLVQDIPPTGKVDLDIPQIYYGENTNDFVIVNTNTQEVDFPGPEGTPPILTTYTGEGGVSVGSFIRKLTYAWELLDINILISNQLTSDSKVMYRRNISERVGQVAPFLKLDSDPYLVIADGRLWWIQDAYTTTDRYPYSTPTEEGFSYIRNSVKVVMDPFNGSLFFYVVDPDDPILKIYMRAFPDLFEPVTEPDPFMALPEGLREHVRYPIDLFSIQAQRYLQYHMEDPLVFFQKEDQWAFGNELFFDEPQQVKPYYVIMKLPGETREEFVLMMPFTPFDKKTMVAWMAARNDAPNYGELQTFTFSGNVFGPELVEARITNDDEIRKRLTLLCPPESTTIICIRGNLLVVPLTSQDEQRSTVLFVEPLFIRPATEDFPPLKQVFVADGTSVVMADTLQEGIALLVSYGEEVEGQQPPVAGALPEPQPPRGAPPDIGELPPDTQQRLQDILEDVRTLQEALSDLEQDLEEVAQPAGGGLQ